MPQNYRLVDDTLEIDGVRMHQTAKKKPINDAKCKVAALRAFPGALVLDICTGLGYSAIEFGRKGCYVKTVEKDPNVLEIAKTNPPSASLFGNAKITIFNEDATALLPTLPANSFDLICHDPPRLSMAGELYSEAFYRELYRVMRRGGRLFHYTGSPGIMRGKNIPRGVKDRLLRAGFLNVVWRDDLQGFLAAKLR